jgi:hypothetical protein
MTTKRIVGRRGGHPSFEEIRAWTLAEFPPGPHGRSSTEVLAGVTARYRIRFKRVAEREARLAVLAKRAVVATFVLSKLGWEEFGRRYPARMAPGSVSGRGESPTGRVNTSGTQRHFIFHTRQRLHGDYQQVPAPS